MLRLRGSGSPHGSDVLIMYVLSNNCTSTTHNLTDQPQNYGDRWGEFSESGIDLAVAAGGPGQLNVRIELPLPFDIAMGEHYREVRLRFNQ